MANNNEVTFNVTKSIWRLNNANNGWQKEVNLVSWNGAKPRIDIRDWNADKTKMKKGISLFKDEALELKKCLNSIDLESYYDNSNASLELKTGPGPVDAGTVVIVETPMNEEHENEEKSDIT